MARVLIAWELGAGYGHLVRMRSLALALAGRGHRVELALRDLAAAERVLGGDPFPRQEAPHWLAREPGPGLPASHADILLRMGWDDAAHLSGLVRGWRDAMARSRAEVVVTDHAPTAALAARTLDIPVGALDQGFTVPPAVSPLPSFRPWNPISEVDLVRSDRDALHTANAVLGTFGARPAGALHEVLVPAAHFLDTYPELDHYGERPGARYYGQLPLPPAPVPAWPEGRGKRVFIYLGGQQARLEACLAALERLACLALVHADAGDARVARHARPGLAACPGLVDIGAAARSADLVICHAGPGTVARALLSGRPLLQFPGHVEQYLVARNVERLGAGLAVLPEQKHPDVAGLLERLLFEPAFTRNAQDFAVRYADWDSQQALADICETISELAARAPRGQGG